VGSETTGSLGSLESLREHNRRRVLDALRNAGVASRAEIARSTGLSRSTVSTIVADLQARGLLIERADADATAGAQGGRPPVRLSLDRSAGATVGIAFSHDHVRVAVADLGQRILAEDARRMNVGQSATEGLAVAEGLVDRALLEAGIERRSVLGAGLGIPGPIDRRTGTVGSHAILPGWDGVRAGEDMAARLGVPVYVENDANLEALAEALQGAGRGVADVVYIMVSAGIGAGVIIGGRLHRGARGTAGEIGHVLIDENGDVCRCGNRGCLETLAAGPGLADLLRRTHGPLSVPDMLSLASDGDTGVRRVIEDAGRHIGVAAANVCNVLNPERVIVGGELSAAGDLLLDPLRDALRRYAISAAAEDLTVVAGELGERAGVMGALVFAAGESGGALSSRLASVAEAAR
jgi:predicted NBD/HSP70 family sugar kinase